MLRTCCFLWFFMFFLACVQKEFDPNDPAGSFATAREPFDDKDYEIAITRLGEYKARFPYSKFAVMAELLIANSQFELGRFDEAAGSYVQFVKLHPKHEQIDFAMYRVGESYWSEAPEEIDRDQELTAKAAEEWQKLINRMPESEYAIKAKKFVEQGYRRIAESMNFVASFYCKQDLYHACAFRFIKLAESYKQFSDLKTRALLQAADALQEVAKEKRQKPDSDKNIYHAQMTADQIDEKAQALRKAAQG